MDGQTSKFTYVVVPAPGYEKCGWHVDAGTHTHTQMDRQIW